MRRLLLSLALLLWAAVPSEAAIGVVQLFQNRGDSVTTVYPAPLSAGTHVLLTIIVNSKANTVSIDDVNPTDPAPLFGPVDHATENLRGYVFCFPSETGDTDFRAHSSASGNVMIVGAELSGASCTPDDTASGETATTQTHTVAGLTTTVNGSFVLAAIHGTSVTNFEQSVATVIPSNGDDILGGDNVGIGLGAYIETTTAGAQTISWTSSPTNETTLYLVGSVQAAAVSGNRGLLLFGCCEDQR